MKKKHPLKLKSILIALTTVIIISTLGVSGIASFRMFEKLMVKKIAESRVDVLLQISEKILAIQQNTELLSNLFYYNENLTDLYHEGDYSDKEKKR